jgi:YkoY family integral membrane protein
MFNFLSSFLSLNGLGIVFTLVILETLLSADNAIALAALVGEIPHPRQQRQVLDLGLMLAFIFRITLLITATWLIQFWQFEVLGGCYLIGLSFKHFWQLVNQPNLEDFSDSFSLPNHYSWGQMISLIALTDLAFSLDSITTAVALSDHLEWVIIGCTLGMITLRFLAGLFIRWLMEFYYLENAAYLMILVVGIRLVSQVLLPSFVFPQWIILILMGILLTWGFSRRTISEL